jgi:hypothetical protein
MALFLKHNDDGDPDRVAMAVTLLDDPHCAGRVGCDTLALLRQRVYQIVPAMRTPTMPSSALTRRLQIVADQKLKEPLGSAAGKRTYCLLHLFGAGYMKRYHPL